MSKQQQTVSQEVMEAPEVQVVPIGNVTPAPYNPVKRISDTSIKRLEASIAKHGLINEVVVDDELNIIDGHRRHKACKNLGHQTIRVKFLHGVDGNEIYAVINETSKKLSGNDMINVWLKQPGAVPSRIGEKITEMVDVLGRAMVRKMARRGCSLRTWTTTKRVSYYLNDERPAFIKKIVQWMMDNSGTGHVDKVLSLGITPASLRTAINDNKPVKLTFE